MANFSIGAPANSVATGTTQKTSSTNMDANSLKALQNLIAQLQGAGTPGIAKQNTDRATEIATNQATRSGYTKEAAMADATGAMNAQVRAVLEKLLPSLTRSAEGSGTSQSSLRALLTQDAATKAAESAATLGLNASAAYGGVNANLSQILAGLVNKDDPQTAALLAALSLAKGSTSSSTTNTQQPVGMSVPSYGSSGGANIVGSGSGAAQPNYMMGASAPGMSDLQAQTDSINKQLGLLGQLTSMGAFGSPTSTTMLGGVTF